MQSLISLLKVFCIFRPLEFILYIERCTNSCTFHFAIAGGISYRVYCRKVLSLEIQDNFYIFGAFTHYHLFWNIASQSPYYHPSIDLTTDKIETFF